MAQTKNIKNNRDMTWREIFPKNRKAYAPDSKFVYISDNEEDEGYKPGIWSDTACMVLVLAQWEDSLWKRNVLESLLVQCRFIPKNIDQVIMLPAEDAEYEAAMEIASGHPDSFILCDTSGKLEQAVLPSDALVPAFVDKLGAKGDLYKVSDKYDLLPDDVADTFRFAQITTAEMYTIEVTGSSVATYGTYTNKTSTERREDVALIYDLMSFGKITLPTRTDFGISEDTPIHDNISLSLATPLVFSVSLRENEQAYVDAIDKQTKLFEDVNQIWDAMTYNTPFHLNINRTQAARYNREAIEGIGRVLGVDKMIEAVLDHSIPVKDVLVGRLPY